MKIKPEILHEDEQLLIVNKPTGLLSVPDRYDPTKPNLLDLLRDQYGDVIKVHRLDKETSGVICFARDPNAHRHLSLQFEHHEVSKVYTALVEGVPAHNEGTIEQAIAPDPVHLGRMIASSKGKKAVTHYQVIERFQRFALIEASIQTGRTHQIRVHFKHLGHPLAVDEFYGPRKALFLSEIKGKRYRLSKDREERPLLNRLSLHARSLSIKLPGSTGAITVEAPFPKDLRVTIKQLEKWGR